MSQSPVKKEVSVKLESENIPLSSQSAGESFKSADQGWQDIPLKSCTKEEIEDIRFHIMKFQSAKEVDIVGDFTKPVRLHRKDPRNIQFQLTREEIDKRKKEQVQERLSRGTDDLDEADKEALERGELPRKNGLYPDMSQVAPDGGARKPKKNMFKRKTRQINLMDDKKRKLRYEEFYPWVVEDYDGKNVFVGNYEAGSSDTQHVLFVFDKDGFKMVPAEKVYRFTPRNRYATLTLEEAEAKMEKNSSVPRWLMKHMEDKSTSESTPDQRFRNSTPSNGSVVPAFNGNSRRQLRTVMGGGAQNDRDSDHDDLDFDEEFADDEEAPIMDGDEEENKLSEQKIKKEMLKAAHFDGQSDAEGEDDIDDLFETEKSRKVDKEGKKLRKVLNKTEGGAYDSDDEDDKLNPYLSKSDLESNDESDDQIEIKKEEGNDMQIDGGATKNTPRSFFAHNLGDGFVSIKAPSGFLNGFPKGDWMPNGRKRPSPTPPSPKRNLKLGDGRSPKKIKIGSEDGRSPSPVDNLAIVDLNSSGPSSVLVTVKEVLDIVRVNPLTTKDLLISLKSRVSAHRDNKQRIISIVKQNLKLVDGKLVLRES
jgi:transcription initiation factor TFIIF subunit alpha